MKLSKSQFKPRTLDVMRRIGQTGETLVITDHGRPTLDNFHRDPADRMLVALARHLSVPLITADEKILAYKHVKTIW